ncbi:DUF5342 family protein [Rossellomorea marisflavi]|uniref:DUF5342 family protein n=1 Tax=Rossellomorea marisflavi TaxID=189381 RepID=UPI002079AC91|nr:DUF5342 family protein [Rossellomorea marisflavi]USK93690.1 YheE family protein [Rossellomorea marisflavi]
MIQHFQYRSMYENKELPGWYISFFYGGVKHEGTYHKDGRIDCKPALDEKSAKQIHDLMLFHVYE